VTIANDSDLRPSTSMSTGPDGARPRGRRERQRHRGCDGVTAASGSRLRGATRCPRPPTSTDVRRHGPADGPIDVTAVASGFPRRARWSVSARRLDLTCAPRPGRHQGHGRQRGGVVKGAGVLQAVPTTSGASTCRSQQTPSTGRTGDTVFVGAGRTSVTSSLDKTAATAPRDGGGGRADGDAALTVGWGQPTRSLQCAPPGRSRRMSRAVATSPLTSPFGRRIGCFRIRCTSSHNPRSRRKRARWKLPDATTRR
jgi:hypothetical protein